MARAPPASLWRSTSTLTRLPALCPLPISIPDEADSGIGDDQGARGVEVRIKARSLWNGGRTIRIDVWHGERKHVACIMTAASVLRNMFAGVLKGFCYEMRAVYAHFPLNLTIADDDTLVEVRNFLVPIGHGEGLSAAGGQRPQRGVAVGGAGARVVPRAQEGHSQVPRRHLRERQNACSGRRRHAGHHRAQVLMCVFSGVCICVGVSRRDAAAVTSAWTFRKRVRRASGGNATCDVS
eukprot:ctg_1092.g239